jgi:hypothetical protein
MLNVPVLCPSAVGVKVTEMKHVLLNVGKRTVQVCDVEKSPVAETPLIVRLVLLLMLRRVMVLDKLEVFRRWFPNVRLVGVSVANVIPIPLRGTE